MSSSNNDENGQIRTTPEPEGNNNGAEGTDDHGTISAQETAEQTTASRSHDSINNAAAETMPVNLLDPAQAIMEGLYNLLHLQAPAVLESGSTTPENDREIERERLRHRRRRELDARQEREAADAERRRREARAIAEYQHQQRRRRCMSDQARIRNEENAEDMEELHGAELKLSYEGLLEMNH